MKYTIQIGMFQFHNGSIKTIALANITREQIKFQFHNGSIKTFDIKDINEGD